MRSMKLSLLLGLVVLGLAGCTSSTGNLSGSAVEPPAGGEGTDLGPVLLSYAPTARVDWADLEKACADQGCTADLEEFKSHLEKECPSASGCTDPVANLLYLTRTNQQRSGGIYPSTFPPVEAIIVSYEDMTGGPIVAGPGGDTSGGAGSTPGGGSGGSGDRPADLAGVATIITGVAQEVASSRTDLGWTEITELIDEADTGNLGAADEAMQALKEIPVSSPVGQAAETLASGGTVPPADANLVLIEIAEALGNNVN
jgi:hypothetical protein